MSENTKIEWATHSWSLWRGCTKVSPGCANCYAEKLSLRNPKVLGEWGRGRPRAHAKDHRLPMKWNKNPWICPDCGKAFPVGAMQFDDDCNCTHRSHRGATKFHRATVFPSLCDWLDDEVPVAWLAEWLELIHATPNLRWLMLTKRPENWRQRLELVIQHLDETDIEASKTGGLYVFVQNWLGNMGGSPGFRPPNIWPGTSVEDQPRADQRIPALLSIPAEGRFLSVEPLLGQVELPLSGNTTGFPKHIRRDGSGVGMPQRINWVIIGGESGHGARPCNVDWIRSLVRQCKDASVPCFVKQLGARPVEEILDQRGGHLGHRRPEGITHPKGGDPEEWPSDLRVREFPEGLR